MPLLLDENIRLREMLTELRAENERLRDELAAAKEDASPRNKATWDKLNEIAERIIDVDKLLNPQPGKNVGG